MGRAPAGTPLGTHGGLLRSPFLRAPPRYGQGRGPSHQKKSRQREPPRPHAAGRRQLVAGMVFRRDGDIAGNRKGAGIAVGLEGIAFLEEHREAGMRRLGDGDSRAIGDACDGLALTMGQLTRLGDLLAARCGVGDREGELLRDTREPTTSFFRVSVTFSGLLTTWRRTLSPSP